MTSVDAEPQSENGPGGTSTYDSHELYDSRGLNRWSRTAANALTYRDFDPATGTVVRVLQLFRLPDGTLRVLVEGLCRCRVERFQWSSDYYTVKVALLEEPKAAGPEVEAQMRHVLTLFNDYVHLNRRIPDEVLLTANNITDAASGARRSTLSESAELLAGIPTLARLAPVVAATHERYNGSGYPVGLAGTAIPLAARIISVADAHDAMTGRRPYGVPLSHADANSELERCAGTHFDLAGSIEHIVDEVVVVADDGRHAHDELIGAIRHHAVLGDDVDIPEHALQRMIFVDRSAAARVRQAEEPPTRRRRAPSPR